MKKSMKIGISIVALVCMALMVSSLSPIQLHDLLGISLYGGDMTINRTGYYTNGSKLTKSGDKTICPEGTNEGICDTVCIGECGTEFNSNVNSIKNGTILFKKGMYNISNTMVLKDNIDVFCEKGAYFVVDKHPTLSGEDVDGWDIDAVFMLNRTKNNKIEGCKINGSGDIITAPADPEDGMAGIWCHYCEDSEIINNEIFTFGTDNTVFRGYGILYTYANHSTARGNTVYDNGYEGIAIRIESHDIYVEDNLCYENNEHCMQVAYFGDTGTDSDCAYDVYITGNTFGKDEFYKPKDGRDKDDNFFVHHCDDVTISDNIIPRIVVYGNVSRVKILNNRIRSDYNYLNASSYGIILDTITVDSDNIISDITIKDNSFMSNQLSRYGIRLLAWQGTNISNVYITDNFINYNLTGISFEPRGIGNLENIYIEKNTLKSYEKMGITSALKFGYNLTKSVNVDKNIIVHNEYAISISSLGDIDNLTLTNNIFEDNEIIFDSWTDGLKYSNNNLGYMDYKKNDYNVLSSHGMLGYYPLDSDASDYSGESHDGSGNYTYGIAKYGMGAYFYCQNNQSILTGQLLPQAEVNFTIAAWARSDSKDATTTNYIVSQWQNNKGIFFMRASNDDFSLWVDGGQKIGKVDYFKDTDEFKFMAVTYDGNYYSVYLDGLLYRNMTGVSYPDFSTVTNFTIGNRQAHDRPFNGTIDNVMVWNRTLSDAEIATLYSMDREYIPLKAII